ncbi:MAG: hypothetical protein HRF43_03885 [Phycisphaerae bacterium]|jgi:hypothetical protein
MNAVHARSNVAIRIAKENPKLEARCRKQAFRAELCAMAVLMGQGLVVVYVIGTLVINCLRS